MIIGNILTPATFVCMLDINRPNAKMTVTLTVDVPAQVAEILQATALRHGRPLPDYLNELMAAAARAGAALPNPPKQTPHG
jgi:hypothetical protein